jgi:beta-glucanase (GH16 family)
MRIIALIVFPLLLCTSCNKHDNTNGNNPKLSSLTVGDVTHARDGKETTTYRFVIDVYPVSSSAITVNYTTKDGTAVSGTDYAPVSGMLTIPAKAYSGYIDVIVTADSLRQDDQTFTLELSSPANSTLSETHATGTIQNPGTYLPIDNSGYTSAASYTGMTLVWSDEFNGKTLNSSNWTYETGGGGWGNSELEYYTNSVNNTFLTGGYLVIEARKETIGTNNYTSARLKTEDKKTFTYGRIDIRARLPKGQGLWPALWMLGNNISQTGYGWPACGEIDIMELLGQNPQKIYGTVHWGIAGQSNHPSSGGNYSISAGDFSSSFHVFSLQWDSTKMDILLDDAVYKTVYKTDMGSTYYSIFEKPFFFVFNVAVGGSWPGNPNSSTSFPQRMIVDYVRIYQ